VLPSTRKVEFNGEVIGLPPATWMTMLVSLGGVPTPLNVASIASSITGSPVARPPSSIEMP
jgi:hypothetical protein